MQEYISKQHQILRPAEQIYAVISRFDNLTPALADRVEEWQATEDTCSFKAKGFTVKLRMAEREAPKKVKIVGDDGGVPMDFAFWIQLHPVAENDTRMRLVLHIELNMMMRMMIGSKLQGAIDQIAEGIARAMNSAPACAPPPGPRMGPTGGGGRCLLNKRGGPPPLGAGTARCMLKSDAAAAGN